MSKWRTRAAFLLGRVAAQALHLVGRGGTALPGLLVETLAPDWPLQVAGSLSQGAVLITGTNGKTTTSRLLGLMAEAAGWRVLRNAAGSNLMRGIASTFVQGWQQLRKDPPLLGVFEVDEATLPYAAQALRPRVLVFTNLFRDQLDRYGEVDTVATLWRHTIAQSGEAARLVLNADDPVVAGLADGNAASALVYFGIEDLALDKRELDHASDARWCPRCGSELCYSAVFYSHIGHYRCQQCGYARPRPQVVVERVELKGVRESRVWLRTPWGNWEEGLPLPGLYNVSNVLAAIAAAHALELPPEAIAHALRHISPAFGRGESLQIEGRRVHLLLVKNPAGFTQVARTLAQQPGELHLVVALNDGFADGRDVSWIWDADLTALAGRCRLVVVSGRRAEDMALRLRSAGVLPSASAWLLEKDLARALRLALARTPEGGELFVLPTYTALLEARAHLARWSGSRPFWKEPMAPAEQERPR